MSNLKNVRLLPTCTSQLPLQMERPGRAGSMGLRILCGEYGVALAQGAASLGRRIGESSRPSRAPMCRSWGVPVIWTCVLGEVYAGNWSLWTCGDLDSLCFVCTSGKRRGCVRPPRPGGVRACLSGRRASQFKIE